MNARLRAFMPVSKAGKKAAEKRQSFRHFPDILKGGTQ
jgi:hypothetical protein